MSAKRYGGRTLAATAAGGLPEQLPGGLRRETAALTRFGGFRAGGVLADMGNLSPRRAPALATRLPRGLLTAARGGGIPHGMTFFDGYLFFVCGTDLFRVREGESVTRVGTVSDTRKEFLSFGDRLYIYPDKLYLERGDMMPCPLELDSGVVPGVAFEGRTVTLPEGMGWTAMGYGPGDCLRVVNADDVTPAPEGYYRIESVRGRVATLVQATFSVYVSDVRLMRAVPSLERCCVHGDRVYGILGRDIYVSAAGSAVDFYSHGAADGADPVILHTDTDGDFTACVTWQGYVIFFKADCIYKLLGSRSDSFSLHYNRGAGIPEGLADTLCEVGGMLYYHGAGGVYRYRGQDPERIAPAFGVTASEGQGGTDGQAYYLSALSDGSRRLCLYRPEEDEWYAEDGLEAVCMVTHRGYLCIQDTAGNIWMTSSDGRATGCAFDERYSAGSPVSFAVLEADHFGEPDGFRLVGLHLRATAEAGASLRVTAAFGDGYGGPDTDMAEPVLLGEFQGPMTDRLLRIYPAAPVCDGMVLRLDMTGDWVIHSLIRVYERAGQ